MVIFEVKIGGVELHDARYDQARYMTVSDAEFKDQPIFVGDVIRLGSGIEYEIIAIHFRASVA